MTSFPSHPSPPGGPAARAGMIAATLSGGETFLSNPALMTAAAWLWLAGRAETPQVRLAMALDSRESGLGHAVLIAARQEGSLVPA